MSDQFKTVAELKQAINPHKGDVPFVVGDKTYTLRFSHLALAKLETMLNKSLPQILLEFQNPEENMRIGTVIGMLWAGLQKHHPKLTYDEAAGLLDDMDEGASSAVQAIGDGLAKAFNAPETKGTNPPQRVNGTGTISGSSTSVSAVIPMGSGQSPLESGS